MKIKRFNPNDRKFMAANKRKAKIKYSKPDQAAEKLVLLEKEILPEEWL